MARISPKPNTPYWAIFTRSPSFPILHGSRYGVRVDTHEGDGAHVFTTREGLEEFRKLVPENYTNGKPIGWEVGQVFHKGDTSVWYDWAE